MFDTLNWPIPMPLPPITTVQLLVVGLALWSTGLALAIIAFVMALLERDEEDNTKDKTHGAQHA